MFTSCRNRRLMLSCMAVLSALPLTLWAEDAIVPEGDSITLDPLVVVSSKSPRPLSEVAAQVTVIDAEDIRTGIVEDLDGLLKYEPGLEVETTGTRFGATGINVRGIGGNRVVIEQDGLTVRDRFVVGAFADSGRALTEIDRIKRVEVLYGPASVLYGSNALGGVVAITTWDPADLLSRTAADYWLGLRAGYQGADESWVGSGVAAVGKDTHGMLFAGTWREGHQLDNQAPVGTPEDPQDWHGRDFMWRYTYETPGGNRLRLTAMGQDTDVKTEMNSQLGYGRRFRTTTALQGSDDDENRQYDLDYEFAWGGWEQATAQVYHADYRTSQLTFETRGKAAPPVALEREFDYQQEHSGFDLTLFRLERWGAAQHRIGAGLQWMQTDTREMRDGLETNLVTGSTTNVILGESLPVRDFPNSRSREVGLFVQDEISLSGGRWELIPAVRWDGYQLEPKPDALWLDDFPDLEVASVTEHDFTPRLGAVFNAGEAWSLYGQYARGFRAPPFEDANIGLDLPLFGYRAIPNPDLQSETSDGIELGARRITAGSRFSLALFDTRYDNFIESRALVGTDPETGDLLFQSRNIGRARIYGIDVRYDQDLAKWSNGLRGWMLNFAAYWSKGENQDNGEPLNSISPPQTLVGISWHSGDGKWDLEATGTLTAAKNKDDIDETELRRFATPSWVILDLTAGWQLSGQVELRAGIFNVGNKTYWRWLDVAGLDAADPMIPVLSRPGRNFSATVRFAF